MAIVLRHATLTQLGNAFRERYRSARGQEAARLARWLLARISDSTFTDAQVRTFFGLTQTQYNQMKTRMQSLADSLSAVDAGVGE